jgi:peptidoglycan/xylan/chitin deacetylase (PgdA/CDA1 family)
VARSQNRHILRRGIEPGEPSGIDVAKSASAKTWLNVAVWTAVAAVALFAIAYGLWQFSKSRDAQLFGRIVARVETPEKVIALTFDDGPTEYSTDILALLKDKGVKATFFVMGIDVEANPGLARAIVADGHELGNHTYTHSDMTLAGWDTVVSEVERTDAAIRAAGYAGKIHFRPPFGKKLVTLPLYLAQHDRITVVQDIEPDSSARLSEDARLMVDHVLDRARPGSIVLLHVMYRSRETSRQALPGIIDGLHERGYRFVTVSELLGLAGAN